MKLVSKLCNNGKVISKSVFSEDCSLGQAFTMIESWCYDNSARYPEIDSILKSNGVITVIVTPHDYKFINEFNIID